jgi:hypothetical protein
VLAVAVVLAFDVAGIGVLAGMSACLHRMVLVRGISVGMRGGGSGLHHHARGRVAERQRRSRCGYAQQIEQGDKPPGSGAHRPLQANEHGWETSADRRFRQA